jgi:anti-anti-sigma factor
MSSINAIDSAPHPSEGLHLSPGLASALRNKANTLRATIGRSGSMVLLRVGGEVDAHNVAPFEALLGQAAAATPAPGLLLVDVNGLGFIACCGFAALMEQSAQCQRRGVKLCLISNLPSTARIMAAGRFDVGLTVHRDLQTALESQHRIQARPELGSRQTADVALVG